MLSCAEFEERVSDFCEGVLTPDETADMRRHALQCANCGPLLESVQATLRVLADLPEVAEPAGLQRAILARTSGQRPMVSWRETLASLWHAAWQPRVAVGFSMAVFAVAMLLNAADVNLRSLRWSDLTPSRITVTVKARARRTLASGERYYENLRTVYRIQAALREIRQPAAPARTPGSEQDKSRKPLNRLLDGAPVLARTTRPQGPRMTPLADGELWCRLHVLAAGQEL